MIAERASDMIREDRRARAAGQALQTNPTTSMSIA
jgi:choline dehydrogenase